MNIVNTDLKMLDLSKNIKLKNLFIKGSANTNLKRLDISNLKDLYQVVVSDCNGLMLFLDNLPSLSFLMLENCNTLHVTNCGRLEDIYIPSGDAEKIEIQNCPKLLPSNGFGIKDRGQSWDVAAVYRTDLLYGSEHYYWQYGKWKLRTEPVL